MLVFRLPLALNVLRGGTRERWHRHVSLAPQGHSAQPGVQDALSAYQDLMLERLLLHVRAARRESTPLRTHLARALHAKSATSKNKQGLLSVGSVLRRHPQLWVRMPARSVFVTLD